MIIQLLLNPSSPHVKTIYKAFNKLNYAMYTLVAANKQ